jgi:murein DD-endopeptidase MepM/ murein hydrolase activator NlpD
MYLLINKKRLRRIAAGVLAAAILFTGSGLVYARTAQAAEEKEEKADFIKWVDFNVPYEILEYAMKLDINSHNDQSAVPLDWIELLAYTATRSGGNWSGVKTAKLEETAKQLREGKTMAELSENLKNYSYFYESYNAALGGLVGEYEIEVADAEAEGGKCWERKYGLKAFSPIAKNYPYNDYDDFGNSRSYGFKRRHLGHDMMGATGTPIIAVEGGTVEAIGWNQYGGWRIGIRSFDKKRYYYYAHLRQNFPFNKSLQEGSVVNPGDVIGYLGHTGYSAKENTNNIDVPHLHFGMELIFDESQKESDNEIWIDVYAIVRLLYRNRSEVVKDPETKEYSRIYNYREVLEE